MGTTKLITMYGSPWSERVRWAFAFKKLPYEKQNYEAGVDEAAVKKLTGQAMVPVLITGDKVIPDSSAILDWLEETQTGAGAVTQIRERARDGDAMGRSRA